MKIAIVVGSARANGNTVKLCEYLAKHNSISLFNLADYDIKGFDYNFENQNDDFIGMIEDILQHDHVVLASPVYWYSVSATMKVFMDRLSDLLKIQKDLGRKLRGKSASIVSTGCDIEPAACFEQAIKMSFEYLGLNYKGMLYCACEDDFQSESHKKGIARYLEMINVN